MPLIGGELGYRILMAIAPYGRGTSRMDGSTYRNRSKLRTLLGDEVIDSLKGLSVLDFGCGEGAEALEIAEAGAHHVIGLDIQEHLLDRGRRAAAKAGLANKITFVTKPSNDVDAIVSLDSFEHFAEPEAVLKTMASILRPGGRVYACFGPTWYHPLGGHLFSVFPWAHLIFTEASLIRWRSTFKSDGATCFSEVAGGLNRMTIGRFERIVQESPLHLESITSVPIRRLRLLYGKRTREFTTAVVRATLTKP